MNLGERVDCGRFTATNIGLADKKVTSIIAQAVDVTSIKLNGADLSTTLTNLAGGAATADWVNITNKPANLVDWTTDQGDTNIDANNIPLLNYAPNTLASNGTAGLSSYNFTEARKNKLASIEEDAQVNVQSDWNATSGDALILNKPTWIPQSDPNYLTAVPSAITDAIALNTAKVGISTAQADAIVANSAKTGITFAQADAIVANSAKTGITVQQANAIVANTAKLGAGQSVGTSDSPTFNQLTLGNAGVNQGIINLQDFPVVNPSSTQIQVTPTTIAQIKGVLQGTNGGKFQIFAKDDQGNLEERFLLQSSIAVFKGNGLNVNTSDNTQQALIYNSLGGDKDMTISAYSAVTDKGISFTTSSFTNRMRIKKNGNVGINTTDPTYRLHVVGDIKGDNLILGEYGETPKIDMLYAQGSNTSVGYDKRITIGTVDDFPNTTGFPANPPSGSMGINIQNNSDGLFIGIEEYTTGNYRPLLKWGDDEVDTPFTITNSFNNKKFEFGVDGRLSVPGLIKGESGTICKIHILPFTDAETANVGSNTYTDTVGKTFTKTAGTNLFGEVHINYTINGFGGDDFQARLNFFNNPGITGGDYDIINDSNAGGGGRSGDINGAAVYTNGTGTTNFGPQGIYLQARRNGADDTIMFKAGFFKVTEIWA